MKIDIPEVLVHLRGEVVRAQGATDAEALAMRALARVFGDRKRYERAQRLARAGRSPLGRGLAKRLPGPLAAWTSSRELPEVPEQTFREWWRETR